ncbi:MAG: hypothetical protein Ta2G_10520 [Termitinemataceae bacterium]|nr:MAG: hypothetical protein Ta2G_10520 [Termitinemataceae bacterium]
MLKKRLALYPFIFFVWGSSLCFAASNDAVWYIANGAGMILEKAFPLRALRSKNALSMQVISETDLPVELRKYYISPWKIMRSVFYDDGKRIKSQWVFRDESDLALFVASIGNDGAGFIEWYNEQGYIIEEQRLDSDGSGYFISYTYKDNVLLKAESHSVEAIPSEPAEKLPVETKTEAPAAAMLPKPQEEAESEEIAQELLMGNSAAVQKEPVNQTAAAKPPTPAAEKVSAQAKKTTGSCFNSCIFCGKNR